MFDFGGSPMARGNDVRSGLHRKVRRTEIGGKSVERGRRASDGIQKCQQMQYAMNSRSYIPI